MSKNPFLHLSYPLNWTELTVDKLHSALDDALALAATNLKTLEALPMDEYFRVRNSQDPNTNPAAARR